MSSLKTKSQRIITFGLALLFLATTIGFTAVVIWQMNKEQKASKQNPITSQGEKLEGTKLANFTAVEKVDKLQVIDLTQGDGEVVKPGASVLAHYTGALAKDGTIFQSSHDGGQPVQFGLDQVIKGWTEGVPGMKVGGTRRLLIPAALAYGEASPSPNIPPNSDLVFDIEMVAVDQ